MTTPRTANELRTDAHHEAGHAVAAMYLKCDPIKFVEVVGHDGKDYYGFIDFDRTAHGGVRKLIDIPYDELFDHATTCLVGPYAELHDQRHRENPEHQSGMAFWSEAAKTDLEMATAATAVAAAGHAASDRNYFTMEERARGEELFQAASKCAKAFVIEHWSEIRKLAIELQKRRVMTGEEIWDFMTAPEQRMAA